MTALDAAVRDRAAGAVLGSAAGDALGAGYEFGPPLDDRVTVQMSGGGMFRWAPGEWTDDTSMAVPILAALADGLDLAAEQTQDRIVAEWVGWARTAPDVGTQTREVFGTMSAAVAELGPGAAEPTPTAAAARVAARIVHDRHGRSAGNGSLMRTGPVALAYLGDGGEDALAAVARALSDLTHTETDAGDACVLWSLAIRHAIRTGDADARVGLPRLPDERRELWAARLDDAETRMPRQFAKNGWVVEALQSAWAAITASRGDDGRVDLRRALELAVRGGNDTDTVAAIAGSLAGASAGASALPDEWLAVLHGWPGHDAAGLRALADRALGGGRA